MLFALTCANYYLIRLPSQALLIRFETILSHFETLTTLLAAHKALFGPFIWERTRLPIP
ncbi:hypothetical protein SBV1_1880002 [Verrucomicrobia bacterium]|nr:hypothetical protein SBV1_1880002 [Verrucomicrobiota bacterium]